MEMVGIRGIRFIKYQSSKTVRVLYVEYNLFTDAWNVKTYLFKMEKIENVKWLKGCAVTYFMPIVLKNGLKLNQMEQIKDYVDNAPKYGIFRIKSF